MDKGQNLFYSLTLHLKKFLRVIYNLLNQLVDLELLLMTANCTYLVEVLSPL